MILKHTCLDGQDRPGDEFDCGACRSLLLDSFRQPPEVRPHLILPEGSARTVNLYPEPEGRVTEPFSEEDAAHITDHGLEPDPDQPGGDWYAACSCGWRESGHYARDTSAAQQTAARLARIKAARHREEADQ